MAYALITDPSRCSRRDTASRQARALTLEKAASPAYGISNQPLPLPEPGHIIESHVVPAIRILGKHVLELLRHKSAFVVVRAAAAPMLVLVDVVKIDAEQGVWDVRRLRRVREV